MIWLAGIVAASAVGSLHCVAMCGPLVGLHGGAKSMRLAFTHSLGRLATYTTYGVLAGAIGNAIDIAGRAASIQRAALVLSAVAIILWGIAELTGKGRAGTSRAFGNALVKIRSRRPGTRAYLTGVLTGLLPCGWLWAFVVSAAGTGSPLTGGAVMAAFWLGTVPAMVGVIAFAGPVFARLRAKMPAISAALLIALGLGTLALRWHEVGSKPNCPLCHERST